MDVVEGLTHHIHTDSIALSNRLSVKEKNLSKPKGQIQFQIYWKLHPSGGLYQRQKGETNDANLFTVKFLLPANTLSLKRGISTLSRGEV